MLGHDLLDAFSPQNGSLGRKLAHHDDDVALVIQKFGNRLPLELARRDLWRTNVGDPLRQRFLSRLKVDVDQRNAGLGDKLRHLRCRRRIDRVNDDRIHLLSDKVLDLTKLLSDIPLGLYELDLHPQFLGLFRHGLSNVDEKLVLEGGQSDPDFLSHRGGHQDGGSC